MTANDRACQAGIPKPAYLTNPAQLVQLSPLEREQAATVSSRYAFRSNNYYQSLIDWEDPNDPIRRIVMPSTDELEDWGPLDASDELRYTEVPGLEHKYRDTALLLMNDVCAGFCRFCFRKRLFMDGNDEVVRDVSGGVAYIRAHPEITNILLTGGDPLLVSTPRLVAILRSISDLKHVRIIRIGTKMLAFNPARVINDPSLPRAIEESISRSQAIFIMAHYNHIAELTPESTAALRILARAGATIVNQTPLIRGVNDSTEALSQLFNELSYRGVLPYYVFQCRPTAGNMPYSVPLEEGFDIFCSAREKCSGLARTARYVMSHATGKIEVLAKSGDYIYMRYHRAAAKENVNRFLILECNRGAHWLDDYREACLGNLLGVTSEGNHDN
ncbi:MAG TPA: hypothetical protein VHU83_00025 [Bryobacteraceae bacterium]|jgi:KamA family protein|nr:hypothetical protein [Bryobacteraceae bacterium]